MNLAALIQDSDLTQIAGDGTAELSGLTDDSRAVEPGCLFVARDAGDERWRGYVDAAIAGGAAAVVAPAAVDVPAGVSLAVGPRIDQALAGRLAARFFGDPAGQLKLVGVTGTNGKTTVATLTQYLLNAAGVKCGLLGTVAIDHGSPDGPTDAELTTPGAIDLHRHFAAMVRHGCTACAMEVSSHALDQGRVDGLEFDVAVFTNLTQDHLDYHGTMEDYAAAKAKLFAVIAPHGGSILNGDDPASESMLPSRGGVLQTIVRPRLAGASEVCLCSDGILAAQIIELRANGSRVRIGCDESKLNEAHVLSDMTPTIQVDLPVVGRHNVCNVLQSLAASCQLCDIEDLDDYVGLLEACPVVPGRLESVVLPMMNTPAVLVDYAHTPDALENVLRALRPVTQGRLICAFGCGGDRDRTKRPLMAQAACGLADRAFLTSDNPRTEDPQRILDDALAGVPPGKRDAVTVEIDRAAAIRAAVMEAGPGDTVLIAGKGHEDYQIIGTEKTHFDDREHAEAALRAWAQQRGGRAGDG